MANCKFLRQKKQVQINGEWVDTRSYRYIPYCDGGTPCVFIKGGKPNGEVFVSLMDKDDFANIIKTMSLDGDGNGYFELKSDDIFAYVCAEWNEPSCVAEISGCYVSYFGDSNDSGMNDISTVIISCSTYRRGRGQILYAFKGKNLIFRGFDTSNTTDMSEMFSSFINITSLDLSSFDTSKVTDMHGMFSACHSLTSLNVSNFNTRNVTNMGGMFVECPNLKSLDLSSFDTSNVTNMSTMFALGVWRPNEGIIIKSELTSLDLSRFNTSNVTDMSYMFGYCTSLTSLDLRSFDTSKVTNMIWMFSGCEKLTSLNLSSFDTSNVTSMKNMFDCCSSLTSLDLRNFNTSNVTNMSGMFWRCTSLTSLDLSGWNTINVTNMEGMFGTQLNDSSLETLDISGWDMSNVTKTDYMFQLCDRLYEIRMVGCNQTTINKIRAVKPRHTKIITE